MGIWDFLGHLLDCQGGGVPALKGSRAAQMDCSKLQAVAIATERPSALTFHR